MPTVDEGVPRVPIHSAEVFTPGPGVRAAAASVAAAAAATAGAVPPAAGGYDTVMRVLLVEDDDGDAFLVEELLTEVGAPVALSRVRTLAEAVAAVEDVDCVLLDLGLPDASGLDSLRILRSRADQVAVLVLTGLNDEHRGVEAVAVGAQDYLVKGQVDGQLLIRAIRYAIGRRRIEATERTLQEQQLHAEENARLERGLLPSPLITDPAVSFVARYQAGGRRMMLGGDCYDAVQDRTGAVHVMVGDVCGHGPDEAALGIRLRIAWRALVLAGRPAEEILATLQQVLVYERHREYIFATVCMLTIPAERDSVRLYLAGHPTPMLLTPTGVELLTSGRVAPPLGVVDDERWVPCVVPLAPNSGLLLYTDGLIDGRFGSGGERLGTDRLRSLVNNGIRSAPEWRADPGVLIDRLIGTVEELNGGDLVDDVAVLLLGMYQR